jgi:hypothetical protein
LRLNNIFRPVWCFAILFVVSGVAQTQGKDSIPQSVLEQAALKRLNARGLELRAGRSAWEAIVPAEQQEIFQDELNNLRIAQELVKSEEEIAALMASPLGGIRDSRMSQKVSHQALKGFDAEFFDGSRLTDLQELADRTGTFQDSDSASQDPLRLNFNQRVDRLKDLFIASLLQALRARFANDRIGEEAHAIAAMRILTEVYLLSALNLGRRARLFDLESIPFLAMMALNLVFDYHMLPRPSWYLPVDSVASSVAVGISIQSRLRLMASGSRQPDKVRFPRLLPQFLIEYDQSQLAKKTVSRFWKGVERSFEALQAEPLRDDPFERSAIGFIKQTTVSSVNPSGQVVRIFSSLQEDISGERSAASLFPDGANCQKYLSYKGLAGPP